MKSHLTHGMLAGLLATIGGIIYLYIYQNIFLVDYSMLINLGAILGSSMIGCILMSLAYFILQKMKKEKLQGVLNIIFVTISFASIIPPMTMSLPLEVEFPELFPGLVIPMHFFPALAFMSIYPFFKQNLNTKFKN